MVKLDSIRLTTWKWHKLCQRPFINPSKLYSIRKSLSCPKLSCLRGDDNVALNTRIKHIDVFAMLVFFLVKPCLARLNYVEQHSQDR